MPGRSRLQRTPPGGGVVATTREPVWRQLIGSRLVQFGVVGSLIFAVTPAADTDRRISVSGDALAALARTDTQRGNPATDDRLAAIRQRYIEDEILYREGLRLGLDRNDGIIRQRVVQRTLFLAEEMGGASRPPTDPELQAYLDANPQPFALPPNLSFRHVFARTLEELPPPPPGDQPVGGTPSPVGNQMAADLPRVRTRMGDSFADAVVGVEPGRWSDPVQSNYGWHRVYVVERRDGRGARLDEVRQQVQQAFEQDRRQQAVARFLEERFALYDVTVDGDPIATMPPSSRVALRTSPSAED